MHWTWTMHQAQVMHHDHTCAKSTCNTSSQWPQCTQCELHTPTCTWTNVMGVHCEVRLGIWGKPSNMNQTKLFTLDPLSALQVMPQTSCFPPFSSPAPQIPPNSYLQPLPQTPHTPQLSHPQPHLLSTLAHGHLPSSQTHNMSHARWLWNTQYSYDAHALLKSPNNIHDSSFTILTISLCTIHAQPNPDLPLQHHQTL